MPLHGNDSTILKTFIKKVKKLTSEFTEEVLTLELPILKGSLLDKNGRIDFEKFYPSDTYYYQLLSFFIIEAIKSANKIYNEFNLQYERIDRSKKIKSSKTKNKKKLPSGWKIINGGK